MSGKTKKFRSNWFRVAVEGDLRMLVREPVRLLEHRDHGGVGVARIDDREPLQRLRPGRDRPLHDRPERGERGGLLRGRTRRAISCAYWAPKSTTRTGCASVPGAAGGVSLMRRRLPWG